MAENIEANQEFSSRRHLKHTMQGTSILSYQQLQSEGLGAKQREVYDTFLDSPTPLTDRETAKELNYADPNKVRPRRKELVDKGLVKEAGKRLCSVTGRYVITWTIADREAIPVRRVGDSLVQQRYLNSNVWNSLRKKLEKAGYKYAGDGVWQRKHTPEKEAERGNVDK